MSEYVEFLSDCFEMPLAPPSILLCVVVVYWLFVIIGALDIDLFDFDFELDASESILDIGYAPLRFLNLGRIPVMIWISVYAFCAWAIAVALVEWKEPTLPPTFQVLVASFGLGAIATKLLTQPLGDRLAADNVEPHKAETIVGGTCVITTSEATERVGEARFGTDGAPLVLTVRTAEGTLAKGDRAQIIDYHAEENVYIVQRENLEV